MRGSLAAIPSSCGAAARAGGTLIFPLRSTTAPALVLREQDCSALAAACWRTEPGHALTRWRSGLLARTPWGWRPGSVARVREQWVEVVCAAVPHLEPEGLVRAWHHRSLAGVLCAGQAVRVHERHGALDVGTTVLSVQVVQGLGVPGEPEDLESWAAGRGGEVLSLC